MIPSKNIFVQYRVINGEHYLAKQYQCFKLDEVGQKIWEMIDGKTPVSSMAKIIAEQYSVDYDVVHNDIQLFIQQLIKNELIEAI